jgi:hypothetical protein
MNEGADHLCRTLRRRTSFRNKRFEDFVRPVGTANGPALHELGDWLPPFRGRHHTPPPFLARYVESPGNDFVSEVTTLILR